MKLSKEDYLIGARDTDEELFNDWTMTREVVSFVEIDAFLAGLKIGREEIHNKVMSEPLFDIGEDFVRNMKKSIMVSVPKEEFELLQSQIANLSEEKCSMVGRLVEENRKLKEQLAKAERILKEDIIEMGGFFIDGIYFEQLIDVCKEYFGDE